MTDKDQNRIRAILKAYDAWPTRRSLMYGTQTAMRNMVLADIMAETSIATHRQIAQAIGSKEGTMQKALTQANQARKENSRIYHQLYTYIIEQLNATPTPNIQA